MDVRLENGELDGSGPLDPPEDDRKLALVTGVEGLRVPKVELLELPEDSGRLVKLVVFVLVVFVLVVEILLSMIVIELWVR